MNLMRKATAGGNAGGVSVAATPAKLPNVHGVNTRSHFTKAEKTSIPYGAGSSINSKLAKTSTSSEIPKVSKLPRQYIVTKDESKFHYSSPRLNAVRNSSMNRRPAVGPPHPDDHGKLTVVLDVDETLIHSRLSPNQDRFRQTEERKENAGACEEFKITLEDGETVWVNKRPGLDRFLRYIKTRYEVVAYTAGLEEYAKPLLDWLDPEGEIFRHRLYRDSCLFIRGYYVKDLQKLNRSLNRTVLVDNNAFCFLPQLSNGIPISSFYDDPSDNALQYLTVFLRQIEEEADVRPILNQSFDLQNLLREHRDHIIG